MRNPFLMRRSRRPEIKTLCVRICQSTFFTFFKDSTSQPLLSNFLTFSIDYQHILLFIEDSGHQVALHKHIRTLYNMDREILSITFWDSRRIAFLSPSAFNILQVYPFHMIKFKWPWKRTEKVGKMQNQTSTKDETSNAELKSYLHQMTIKMWEWILRRVYFSIAQFHYRPVDMKRQEAYFMSESKHYLLLRCYQFE